VTYEETIEYLYHSLPIFQKEGKTAFKPKLDNILELCSYLDNPQNNLQFIHIAGTNGKGSTSHLLSSVLQEHGFRVGLYTSPHLKSFTERIKINKQEISESEVVEFVDLIKPVIKKIKPSFFEVTVAMAFWYFEKQQPDLVVLEVGMGGRLDSTNIVSPLLSVITNISLDHQQYLGDTLQKIAREKAGIIKPNTPVVIGEIQEETFSVFEEIANENMSPMYFEECFSEIFQSVKTNSYQDKNIQTALKSLHQLENLLEIKFDELKAINAIKDFKNIAGLKGRWQILQTAPKLICDTGHNVSGVTEIVQLLNQEKYNNLHIVWGMVSEKEIDPILDLLPSTAKYYFCKPENIRCMEVSLLKSKAKEYNLIGEQYESVEDAITQAKENAEKNDLIFIGGSTFVVAEIPFL